MFQSLFSVKETIVGQKINKNSVLFVIVIVAEISGLCRCKHNRLSFFYCLLKMVLVLDVITRWLLSSLTWHHRLVRISLLLAHSFV